MKSFQGEMDRDRAIGHKEKGCEIGKERTSWAMFAWAVK